MKKKSKNIYLYLILVVLFIYILYKSIYIKQNFVASPPRPPLPPLPSCLTSNISCATKVFDIIICIGQSNMIGQAVRDSDISGIYLTDPTYSDDINYVIHPKVNKVLFDTNNINSINICESTETNSRYSMATSFGRAYAIRTNKNVLIINVAKSSTGILRRANRNSEYLWQTRTTPDGVALYPLVKDFINRVKAKVCNTSKVVAICYQGSEEDSYLYSAGNQCSPPYDRAYINNYNTKMSGLLNAFKTDIGNPDTKILVGGLLLGTEAASSRHPCSEYFTNNVLKEVARRNSYTFVSSDRNTTTQLRYLQRRLDGYEAGVHFNKLSQIELGKRYAYSYFGS